MIGHVKSQMYSRLFVIPGFWECQHKFKLPDKSIFMDRIMYRKIGYTRSFFTLVAIFLPMRFSDLFYQDQENNKKSKKSEKNLLLRSFSGQLFLLQGFQAIETCQKFDYLLLLIETTMRESFFLKMWLLKHI